MFFRLLDQSDVKSGPVLDRVYVPLGQTGSADRLACRASKPGNGSLHEHVGGTGSGLLWIGNLISTCEQYLDMVLTDTFLTRYSLRPLRLLGYTRQIRHNSSTLHSNHNFGISDWLHTGLHILSESSTLGSQTGWLSYLVNIWAQTLHHLCIQNQPFRRFAIGFRQTHVVYLVPLSPGQENTACDTAGGSNFLGGHTRGV